MRPFIFPTKSPVDMLDNKKQRPLAVKSPDVLKRLSANIARKITPLLRAKEEVDKVYSNGYFENHYPDADKVLKDNLHKKVLAAWTAALNHIDENEREAPRSDNSSGVTIIINAGK